MAFVPLRGTPSPDSIVAALVAAAEHLGNGRLALRSLQREQQHHSAESANIVLRQIDAQLQLCGVALQAAFRRAGAERTTPRGSTDAR